MPARIRFSEADSNGVLTLFHLINYLQDCSTFHGEDVNRGLRWSREIGAAWVIAAWQIHIRRLPSVGDRVVVKTWPYYFRGFMGYRNYTMETQEGELLVSANSEWIFMDLKNNRPVRTEKNLLEIFGAEHEEKLPEEFGERKIILTQQGEQQETFYIRDYHLDTNHHVNNGQYIRMAEQYLEQGFQTVHFRAEYKNQAYLGDAVVPRICRVENGYQISLENPEGISYFTAEFLAI